MTKKVTFLIVGIMAIVAVLAIIHFSSPEDDWICSNGAWIRHGNPSVAMPTTACPGAETNIGLANPASINCVDKGGTLKIETRPDGGEFGVCYFMDNYQCEEWALYRGDCSEHGRKVTGYVTEAGRYCAITGGEYTVTDESEPKNEKGACALPNSAICDADAYYQGSCPIVE